MNFKKITFFFSFFPLIYFGQVKNILFIGNSLTYYYDMPKMLETMLNEDNGNYKVVQHTAPGIQLQYQVIDEKLKNENWDFVVLQNGTYGYLVPEMANQIVIPNILRLKNILKSKQTYLFTTWTMNFTFPKKACYPKLIFDNSILDVNDKFCSIEFLNKTEESRYLESVYTEIAKKTNINLTLHSRLEMEFEKKYPQLNMFDDEIHPSKLGSFFNACIFFKTFDKRDLRVIKSNFDIDENTAKIIKNFVQINFVY